MGDYADYFCNPSKADVSVGVMNENHLSKDCKFDLETGE